MAGGSKAGSRASPAGPSPITTRTPARHSSLYEHLEQVILPLYYQQPDQWRRIMRSTIALNGSYFNTQRMLEQYVQNSYFPQSLRAISGIGNTRT